MSYAHLDPNDPSVFQALQDVMDPNTSTNWVLFGYAPKTARLKVIDTGDGDVSEIAELVSDGKLMFAYLRKEMSETWKFVLIAWCGDGVPANIKGFFPTHKEEMEAFLRKNNFNYAAMISAREESDLDEAEIVKALNKTSTFIRARTAKDKPVEKLDDVRNRYWTNQRQQETKDKEAMAARKKAKEAEAQASLESDRLRMQRQAEAVLAQREAEREQAAERFKEEEAERTQKQNAYFESQHRRVMGDAESSAPAPSAGGAGRTQAPISRGKAAARFMSSCQQQDEPKPAPRAAPRPAARRPAPAPQPEPEPEPEPAQESSWGSTETYEEPAATETYEEQPQEQPQEETYEEQPQEEQSSWGNTETYEEQPAAETYEEQPAETYEEQPAETYEEQPAETYEEQPQEGYDEQYQEGGAGGEQARALYDYEAQQEGDLEFHEGDIINLIDTSDPSGWWVGELNGVQGNFPSNFVEKC